MSADYDKVIGFFEFTQRFLDRLSMIEGHSPEHAPFQRCITRVFSSMLTICAVAQEYAKEKRFSEFISFTSTLSHSLNDFTREMVQHIG